MDKKPRYETADLAYAADRACAAYLQMAENDEALKSISTHQLLTAIRLAIGAAKPAKPAKRPKGCHRSHPHEDMNAECERKTLEVRRANDETSAKPVKVEQQAPEAERTDEEIIKLALARFAHPVDLLNFARALLARSPAGPQHENFDAWQANPYTKVLQQSIKEDYVPRCDTPAAPEQKAKCTLCAGTESAGFYTGCMIKDGNCPDSGWDCDGKGNLIRCQSPTEQKEGEA